MNAAPHHDWRRHTRKQTLRRFAIELAIAMAVVWAATGLDIYWPFLWDAPPTVLDLARRMLPPDWSFFDNIVPPMIETVNIATLGTILAVFMAFPVAVISARNTTPNAATYWLGRLIVVSSRSVNELVWGLIMVVFFGPGALAGVAAIALRSVGFTAKLLAEAIEEIDRGQVEAIEASGASRPLVFLYGIVPQIMPAFWGVTVFRWDINIRQSSVIGLVGAGGIGIVLNSAMNLFRWDQVTVILIAIFAVVLVSETVSAALRAKYT
ncbi:MAG TPA: phosphonate ABC transporter, permease protein PhnE [bacterium]|nr:phosphonate ABC transporter, permease protein PhnE [bacterium]